MFLRSIHFFRAPGFPGLGLLLALLLTMSPAPAADPVAPPAADDSPAPLALREVIARALENNFSIRIARLAPLIALDDLAAERAAWDPRFFVEARFDDTTKRQNALEFTATGGLDPNRIFFERNFSTSSGFGGRTPVGTQWRLYSQVKDLTNSINRKSGTSLFSPEYEAFTGLELTQPLLQGFGAHANLARYRIAESRLDQERFTRRTILINTTVDVVNAYYDLVFGQENLRAKQESVRLAEQLVAENRRRLAAGRMTPVDVGHAEVRLGEAREEAILAGDFLRERRVKLLRLTLAKAPEGPIPQLTVNDALPDVPESFDGPALQNAALANRPDYLGGKAEATQGAVRERLARNRRLPKVDLQASFGYGGLERDVEHAYRDLYDNTRAQWGVGLSASLPIGNREAAANHRAARRAFEKAQLHVQELELSVRLDVTNAVGRLAALRQRLATAEHSTHVAEAALAAETRRLEAGQATTFAVAEMQEKVSSARSRLSAARVDLVKALNELYAVTGTLLEQNGFSFGDGNGSELAAPDRPFWAPDR